MVSSELIARLSEARRRVPGDTWRQLSLRLAACPGVPEAASIAHATAALLNRDAAWILSKGFQESAHALWTEIAAAMVAVEYLVGDNNPLTEIIWTGPTNGRFPVRRVDQVLYDLVSSAKKRMILVTFAAHRVRHLCAHLTQAVERGVDLELIVESEGESEGQLTLDAIAAFSGVPNTRTRLYYWPLAKRERNSAGRPYVLALARLGKSLRIDHSLRIEEETDGGRGTTLSGRGATGARRPAGPGAPVFGAVADASGRVLADA